MRLLKLARIGLLIAFSGLSLMVTLRILAYAKRSWAFERARRADLAILQQKGCSCCLSHRIRETRDSYAVLNRIRFAGVLCEASAKALSVGYDSQKGSFTKEDELLPNGARVYEAYRCFSDNPRGWIGTILAKP